MKTLQHYPILCDGLTKYECGGGGWTRSGSVQISAFTGELKFTFKCASHHAVCCPAAIRALIAPPLGEQKACVYLERAEGWAHDHTGPNRAITGLPPHLKTTIDVIVGSNPTIKLKTLQNQLYETHGVSQEEFHNKIGHYFYHNCAQRHSASSQTGVSSFGTVATFADAQKLVSNFIKHVPSVNYGYLNVAGVIVSDVDSRRNRALILFSTPKLLLDTYVQSS